MRIAQLAPLVESVPPQGYGGTELVVSLLTEALVEHGHQVTLFATGDSVTSGRLVSIAPAGLRKALAKSRHRWVAYDLKALLKLQEMQEEFDIIHFLID
jgi:glycosyltransferase involved in cell wall biosynthesis